MHRCRSSFLPLALSGALLALPSSLLGQTTPQPAWRAGLAGGVAVQRSATAGPAAGLHAVLSLGYAPARWPVELRAEASWGDWSSYAGPVATTVGAVLPLRRFRLEPYAIAGGGTYGIGGRSPVWGWNAGVGARAAWGSVGLYAEGRRHWEYAHDLLTVGMTYRLGGR